MDEGCDGFSEDELHAHCLPNPSFFNTFPLCSLLQENTRMKAAMDAVKDELHAHCLPV